MPKVTKHESLGGLDHLIYPSFVKMCARETHSSFKFFFVLADVHATLCFGGGKKSGDCNGKLHCSNNLSEKKKTTPLSSPLHERK